MTPSNSIGLITSYTYDSSTGQLTQTNDPAGYITQYIYDAAGELTSTVSVNKLDSTKKHTTSYTYDLRGRQTIVTYDDGSQTEVGYDFNNNVIWRADQNCVKKSLQNCETTYYYQNGRLMSVTYATGSADQTSVSYSYDGVGNVMSIIDGNSHTTSFQYDGLNRVSQKNWADNNTYETFGYDLFGNMTDHKLINPLQSETDENVIAYDVFNRPTSDTYTINTVAQPNAAISYTYLSGSQLCTGSMQPCSVTYGTNTTTSYTYDAFDRITNVARGSQSVGYTYFPTGMRQTMTTPADTVNYTYNPDNQLLTVSDSGGSIIDNIVYDGFGLRQKVNLHNGVEVDYTFDDLNRLTDLVQQVVPQNPIASYQYKLDANGNRTSVTEADGSVIQWSYDGLYRLTSETRCTSNCTPPQPPPSILVPNTAPTFVPGAAPTAQPPPTNGLMDLAPGTAQPAMYVASAPHLQSGTTQTNYTYDLAGNRQSITTNGQSLYYAYNALDQLTCTDPNQTTVQTCTGAQTRYSYNAPGDLTSISTGGNTINYTWDARNRMTGVSLNGQGKATFVYDDSGHRIQSTIGGTVTNYLWDEQSAYGDVVMEASASWASEQANYALGDGELITQQRNNTTSYYLHDGQGNVRTLVNPTNGQVTDRYSYDAYGNATHDFGSTANSYQYAGQQLDQISGVPPLYDLRARYYNPNSGGFLSQDPLQADVGNTGNLNRYWYSNDNPINFFDPSGRDDEAEYGSLSSILRGAAHAVWHFGTNVVEGAIGGALGYFGGLTVWAGLLAVEQKKLGRCTDSNLSTFGALYGCYFGYFNPYDLAFSIVAGAISGGVTSSVFSGLFAQFAKSGLANASVDFQAIEVGVDYFFSTEISSHYENGLPLTNVPLNQRELNVFLAAATNAVANVTAVVFQRVAFRFFTSSTDFITEWGGAATFVRAALGSFFNAITELVSLGVSPFSE